MNTNQYDATVSRFIGGLVFTGYDTFNDCSNNVATSMYGYFGIQGCDNDHVYWGADSVMVYESSDCSGSATDTFPYDDEFSDQCTTSAFDDDDYFDDADDAYDDGPIVDNLYISASYGLTAAPTVIPTTAVTTGPFDIYVVGYTDGYCSDYFGGMSVPNGRDGCFSETVDGTLVSVMAECVSPDTSSQWTVNVFLSSDCSGSSIASFVGYGNSECAFLSAYGYHISAYVNCANAAVYGPSGSSGSDDDNAGAIAGGVIGALVGVAIIAGAVYYFAVFKPASTKESLDKEGNAL
jgi:hypothetical protein